MSTNDRNLSALTELTSFSASDLVYLVRQGSPNLPRKAQLGNLLSSNPYSSVINVKAAPYNAVGDGTTDDTAAVQAALNAVDPSRGGLVYFPQGRYKTTAPLVINKFTTLSGDGWFTSLIYVAHTGDGLQSTWPINSSTQAFITVQNLGVTCTVASNTGGGFVDVGGTYITLDHCLFQNFKYQVIFDQTEISQIFRCFLNGNVSTAIAGLWLVNGPEHTGGASQGYTNVISVTESQFNSAASVADTYCDVLDSGGANHYFAGNNFNGNGHGYEGRFNGVRGLTLINNEGEGHNQSGYRFGNLSLGASGAYVGPCYGVSILNNQLAEATNSEIIWDDGNSFEVQGNVFTGFINCVYSIGTDTVVQLHFKSNAKILIGASKNGLNYLDAALTAQRFGAQSFEEKIQTYSAGSTTAGAGKVITPAGMGYTGATDRITTATKLLCINDDGTNAEILTPSAVSATTFTATFASAKNANFRILGAG